MRPLSRLAICFVISLWGPGCALMGVRPDSRWSEGRDCSGPIVAPVVDGLFAASEPAPGAPAGIRPACDPSRPSAGFAGPCFIERTSSQQRAGAGSIAVNLVEAAAATYGMLRGRACREASRKLTMPATELAMAPGLDLARVRAR
jgi:hypothetical protein